MDPRSAWLTLVAMTLAGSMILVDQTAVPLAIPHVIAGLDAEFSLSQWILTANVLPLAALMVFGGRLGDLIGLRKTFLIGAVMFIASSALAGAAQSIEWLIAVRATQGAGAALMMPTSVAIVTAVFPADRRGRALGLLAGASAFFAALGPVIGGLLTDFIDWRAVFYVNVPLAAITVLLTLRATPDLRPGPGAKPRIDYPGVIAFAIGTGALVFGLGQGQAGSWSDADTVIPLAVGVVGLAVFAAIEVRVREPLMRFGLFRHLNFLAANVSQVLAGSLELGLAFLMPSFLLLLVELDPATAGLALIPATIPVIFAAPLAGRAFDRIGGRLPLSFGFLVLAASCFYLSAVFSHFPGGSYWILVPGLVLQGLGLGVVLTTNDPTGLSAVPKDDRGEAAGIINTTEQLGGALGIAVLWAITIGHYRAKIADLLEAQQVPLSDAQIEKFREFILSAEQTGLGNAKLNRLAREVLPDAGTAYVSAFELTFVVAGGIALLGAVACFLLVRRGDRITEGRIFSRRSRWALASAGEGPGLTRRPIEDERESGGGPQSAEADRPSGGESSTR